MTEDLRDHAELVAAIDAVMLRFVTRTVLFHQAVGQAIGLNATDLHCLNLLLLEGPMTAGQLARSSGLTTGAAITGAIDRLEQAGYAQRTRDATDRRKVLISPNRDRVEKTINPLYEEIGRLHHEELGRRDADQLAAILDYLTSATDATYQATRAIRRDERRDRDGRGDRRDEDEVRS